jgi:glycosyltransferase involved in cell wall biosynthesis
VNDEILIVTSLAAEAEPRAPRHALAARMAFPDARIVFVEMRPQGMPAVILPEFEGQRIETITVRFPTRDTAPLNLAFSRGRVFITRLAAKLISAPLQAVFGTRSLQLQAAISKFDPALVVGHNIETFLPCFRIARRHGARFVFDCMEYYADMGDSQSRAEAKQAEIVQKRYLKACHLVLATSERLGNALVEDYGATAVFSSHNVPYLAPRPEKSQGPLRLYWRNSVLGFGQRGLEDALRAMTMLPADVVLYLQGRPATDGGKSLMAMIRALGIEERVTILPPYQPNEAIAMASPYDIGLCLERSGPRNHELTVSNKMFDYHMAELAIVASDMPALADIVRQSESGLLYRAGSSSALAEIIHELYSDRELLARLQQNARRYAETCGNREVEMRNLSREFSRIMGASTNRL